MAVFTLQSPDGRKIKIEAADEATAMRGAQEWYQSQSGVKPSHSSVRCAHITESRSSS